MNMFKEKRIIHFEELDLTNRKKKKAKGAFFDYQVEIPKGKIDSVDKENKVSEHKEILTIKQMQNIKREEEKEERKDRELAQKLIDELSVNRCPRCNSINIKEMEDKKYFECIDCKNIWSKKI